MCIHLYMWPHLHLINLINFINVHLYMNTHVYLKHRLYLIGIAEFFLPARHLFLEEGDVFTGQHVLQLYLIVFKRLNKLLRRAQHSNFSSGMRVVVKLHGLPCHIQLSQHLLHTHFLDGFVYNASYLWGVNG